MLAVIAGAVIAVAALLVAVRALVTGVAKSGSLAIYRDEEPIAFHMAVLLFLLVAAGGAAMAVT